MKSRWRGYGGGSCSFGAGTLALWESGRGKHPAFLPKELKEDQSSLAGASWHLLPSQKASS